MTSLLNDYIRAITETNRPSTESVDKPIEAEIARQSVADEAVQRAIEDIESVKGYLNDVCNHQSVRTYDSLDLAIKLLHQYQKPTDEAPTVGDMHDYALRQMRTEPCEGCRPNKLYCEVYAEGKLWDEGWASYCQNCGRKLVKHDG